MRGDLALDARLAMRAEGIVGVLAAMGGVLAGMAAYLPWYEVTAVVEALGRTQDGPAARLAGWEAHPWGWIVPTTAVVAIAVGLSWAVDRPLPRAEDMMLGCGLVLSASVTLAALRFPPVDRFAGQQLRDMMLMADRLPNDVSLAFSVHPAPGLWICLGASVVVVLAGATVRATR